MTLGSLINCDNIAGQYEGVGIHCIPQSAIYTFLQGRARFSGERDDYSKISGGLKSPLQQPIQLFNCWYACVSFLLISGDQVSHYILSVSAYKKLKTRI